MGTKQRTGKEVTGTDRVQVEFVPIFQFSIPRAPFPVSVTSLPESNEQNLLFCVHDLGINN